MAHSLNAIVSKIVSCSFVMNYFCSIFKNSDVNVEVDVNVNVDADNDVDIVFVLLLLTLLDSCNIIMP